jgi:hypothetical protein
MLSVAEVFFENAEFIADKSHDLKVKKKKMKTTVNTLYKCESCR